jgi:hypothetical protein
MVNSGDDTPPAIITYLPGSLKVEKLKRAVFEKGP